MAEAMSDSLAPTVTKLPSDIWVLIHSACDFQNVMNSMQVCKMFRDELPKLVKSICSTQAITQPTLEYICRTFTSLEELELEPEYDDHLPRLDFSWLHFPCLTRLDVSNSRLSTCYFTTRNTPKLQSLSLEQQTSGLHAFELDLPDLESVCFDFVTVEDCSCLGTSLSACPKLRDFCSYKFWGPDDTYEMHLPNCESLSLTRSDGLEGLRIWAPKLTSLDLQGCFGLRTVQLIDEPPPSLQAAGAVTAPMAVTAAATTDHDGKPRTQADAPAGPLAAGGAADAADSSGGGGSKLSVNLVNTNATRSTMQHLRQHPRVGRQRVFAPNDNAERAWEAVTFGHGGINGSGSGGSDGDSDRDDDDEDDDDMEDDDDDEYEEDMGAAFLQAVGGGGFGGFGAFGGFAGHDDLGADGSSDDDSGDPEEDEGMDGQGDVGLMGALRQGGPEAHLLMMLLQQMQGAGGMMGGMGMGGGMMGGGHGVVIEEESEDDGDSNNDGEDNNGSEDQRADGEDGAEGEKS